MNGWLVVRKEHARPPRPVVYQTVLTDGLTPVGIFRDLCVAFNNSFMIVTVVSLWQHCYTYTYVTVLPPKAQ
jgi:hypothetical protein